jgi:cell division protein FtsB
MITDDLPMSADAPRSMPASPLPRSSGRSRRLIRLGLVILTAALLVDAIVGENGVLALLQAGRQYDAVERALQQSRDDNAALRETARRLREDPGTIEAVARRDLNLIKPGEKVFIVKDARGRDRER